jgi:hypothetical protein
MLLSLNHDYVSSQDCLIHSLDCGHTELSQDVLNQRVKLPLTTPGDHDYINNPGTQFIVVTSYISTLQLSPQTTLNKNYKLKREFYNV